jgi:hypothetical protein
MQRYLVPPSEQTKQQLAFGRHDIETSLTTSTLTHAGLLAELLERGLRTTTIFPSFMDLLRNRQIQITMDDAGKGFHAHARVVIYDAEASVRPVVRGREGVLVLVAAFGKVCAILEPVKPATKGLQARSYPQVAPCPSTKCIMLVEQARSKPLPDPMCSRGTVALPEEGCSIGGRGAQVENDQSNTAIMESLQRPKH